MKLLPFLALAPILASAAGGAQKYAEEIKAHTIEHGAPAHPLHVDRAAVRSGQKGSAGPFKVSTTEPTQVFSHFFETSVGSGHMSLTLREDWRQHIRMAARDLGVKHIRGHGLLDDDMSVSYARGKHAFYNIDSLVDLLVRIGMRPIFELSFMPDWLTSGNNTVCHYKGNADPPMNYSDWGELIGALGSHMVSKYGEKTAGEFFFEVDNFIIAGLHFFSFLFPFFFFLLLFFSSPYPPFLLSSDSPSSLRLLSPTPPPLIPSISTPPSLFTDPPSLSSLSLLPYCLPNATSSHARSTTTIL